MQYSTQKGGVLLILDDMITNEDVVNRKRSNLLKKIFYHGRHCKVSLILTSQKLKDIPDGLRKNATHIICFNLKNKKEEEAFIYENDYIDDIESKYEEATSEPYNFLYINKEQNTAYHNFEREL